MPVNKDLFKLVKVMNRKEKSFFRRFFRLNSAGKDGAMLRLFEKVAELSRWNDHYSEEKLKSMLDKADIKHLPVIKNNLYNLVLKSLTEYRKEMNSENRVKSLLEQYDILFSVSLLENAWKILKKAKKIAVSNELFLEINTILNKERTLSRYILDAEGYGKVIERVNIEHIENLKKLKNLTEMNDLGSRFTLMIQKYPTSKVRDDAALNETKKITEHPLLKDEKLMLSSITLRRFYNLNVVLNEWAGRYNDALYFAKKYADVVENDVTLKKASLHEFIVSQYSVLTSSARTHSIDSYEEAYSKLAKFKSRFPGATERDRLEAMYLLGLSVFSSSADNYHPERGEKLLIEADENFGKHERELSAQQKIVWYFVIARFCYFKNDFSGCGKWLNRLIALPNADLSQDYQCYARIMNIIVAYESGNPDRIEHALRKGLYFLAKRNKIYQYEKIIMNYIKQAFRVKTEREIAEMLEFMHRDLIKIKDDSFESNAFDAFNILPWLERKIRRK